LRGRGLSTDKVRAPNRKYPIGREAPAEGGAKSTQKTPPRFRREVHHPIANQKKKEG